MSVHISGPAWKTTFTNPTDKLVLLSIADQATDTGDCWGSSTRIMALQERTGFGKDAIMDSLHRLRLWGILKIVKSSPGRPTQHRVMLDHLGEAFYYDHRELKEAQKQTGGSKPPVDENHVTGGLEPLEPVDENHPLGGSKPPPHYKDLPSFNVIPVNTSVRARDFSLTLLKIFWRIPSVALAGLDTVDKQAEDLAVWLDRQFEVFDEHYLETWATRLAEDMPVRLKGKYGARAAYPTSAVGVFKDQWSRRPKASEVEKLPPPKKLDEQALDDAAPGLRLRLEEVAERRRLAYEKMGGVPRETFEQRTVISEQGSEKPGAVAC